MLINTNVSSNILSTRLNSAAFARQSPNKFGFALDLFVYLQIINYYNFSNSL